MKVFEFIPEGVADCKVTAWLHTENESTEMANRMKPAMVWLGQTCG